MADLSGKQIDNYRLLGLLGQGSFGAVYLAENVYRKNQVAVKILQMQFSVEEFHEFVNEARIFRLRHPNIVSVLDFGIRSGAPILDIWLLPVHSRKATSISGKTSSVWENEGQDR